MKKVLWFSHCPPPTSFPVINQEKIVKMWRLCIFSCWTRCIYFASLLYVIVGTYVICLLLPSDQNVMPHSQSLLARLSGLQVLHIIWAVGIGMGHLELDDDINMASYNIFVCCIKSNLQGIHLHDECSANTITTFRWWVQCHNLEAFHTLIIAVLKQRTISSRPILFKQFNWRMDQRRTYTRANQMRYNKYSS